MDAIILLLQRTIRLSALRIKKCVPFGEAASQIVLKGTAIASAYISSPHTFLDSHISWTIWYAQKARPRPAHSMIIVGLRPLRMLVL